MQETMGTQMDEDLPMETSSIPLHDDERMEIEQEHERDEVEDCLNTPTVVYEDENYHLIDDELDEDSHKMTLGFIVAFLCLTLILL